MKTTYTEDVANARFKILVEKLYNFRIEFLNGICQHVKELQAMGLDESSIANEVINKVFSEEEKINLPNKDSKELFYFFKSIAQFEVWGGLGEGLYVWQYNPGAIHCTDCIDRNGQEKTLKDWQNVGLPGSGATKCHDNCMCDIISVGSKKK